MDPNWLKAIQGRQQGFNQYAAGAKQYGTQGSPNLGPAGGDAQQGYAERDMEARARRNAMLRRMKAGQSGNFMNSDWLKGQGQ